MRPIVLDASVALSWCFEDEANPRSDRVLDYVRKNSALVPSLWALEVSNCLLLAERKKRISLEGTLAFLELIGRLPIRVVNLTASDAFSPIFKLAHLHSLSSYDASYLYLSVRENKPLVTFDKGLELAAKKQKLPSVRI